MTPHQQFSGTPFKRGRGRGFRVRATTAKFAPTSNAPISQGDNSTATVEQRHYGDAYSNVSFSFSHNVPPPTANQIEFMRRAQFLREMKANHEAAGLVYQEPTVPTRSTPVPAKPNTFNSTPKPLNTAQGFSRATLNSDPVLNTSFQNLSFSKPAPEDNGYVSDAETEANDLEDERVLLSKVRNPNGDIDDQIAPRQEPPAPAPPMPRRRKLVLPPGESCPLPPATLPPAPEPVQPPLPNVFAALAQRTATKQVDYSQYLQVPSSERTILGQWEAIPDLSVATTKRPKREGYGFSYSDDTFNSDMPDTDSEGEEGDEPKPLYGQPVDSFIVRTDQSAKARAKAKRDLPTNDTFTFAPTQQKEVDDMVVLRSIGGSFNFAKPERARPCTSATRNDTIRVKAAANALLKFDESPEIYGNLAARLERMVQAAAKQNSQLPDMGESARKLRDFVFKTIEDRVGTGELRGLVEHEGEWANWFVIACSAGVMHVRTQDCGCKAEWEQ